MKDLSEIIIGILVFVFMMMWAVLPYVAGAWIVLKVAGVI